MQGYLIRCCNPCTYRFNGVTPLLPTNWQHHGGGIGQRGRRLYGREETDQPEAGQCQHEQQTAEHENVDGDALQQTRAVAFIVEVQKVLEEI